MQTLDENLSRKTLGSLRVVRRKLYAIPESDLNAMGLDDQVKYGDSLYKCGLAILKLEAAKLKEINDQFKVKEQDLRNAAATLESDTVALSDAVKIIRVASRGIGLVTNIVKLLP